MIMGGGPHKEQKEALVMCSHGGLFKLQLVFQGMRNEGCRQYHIADLQQKAGSFFAPFLSKLRATHNQDIFWRAMQSMIDGKLNKVSAVP